MRVTPEEAAATLRRRSAEARRAAEARAEETRHRLVSLVKPRLGPHARVWLIGSLAWGGFGERSDADLVFDGVDDAAITAIEIDLTHALRIPIDTLRLSDLPPSFRERVEREGLPIHGC